MIREEWRRVHAQAVSEQELAATKTNLTGAFALRFTNSGSIARMLVGMQLQDLGIDYIDRRNSLIEAVTIEDVRRVANDVLDPDSLVVVVVGRPEGIAPDEIREGG